MGPSRGGVVSYWGGEASDGRHGADASAPHTVGHLLDLNSSMLRVGH